MNKSQKSISFLMLVAVFIFSALTAVPIIRIYNNFYPLEYGGEVAVLAGFILSLYIWAGMFHGALRGTIYKRLFLIYWIPLVLFAIWAGRGAKDWWIYYALLLFGYVMGLILLLFKKAVLVYMIREVRESEKTNNNR